MESLEQMGAVDSPYPGLEMNINVAIANRIFCMLPLLVFYGEQSPSYNSSNKESVCVDPRVHFFISLAVIRPNGPLDPIQSTISEWSHRTPVKR